MNIESDDPITSRIAQLRWSAGIVLAGFLLNAGIVVLLVASSGSMAASLAALAAMGATVLIAGLYIATFQLRATGARPLRENEFPWLRPLIGQLAEDAGIQDPELLISDLDDLNAFATGTGPGKVVFMRGLLHQLPREQVRAVAAHELGHLVNRDVSLGLWTAAVSWWVIIVSRVGMGLSHMILEFSKSLPEGVGAGGGPLGQLFGIILAVFGFVFAGFVWLVSQAYAMISGLTQLGVTRQREWLADATAVALTGEPQHLARALAVIGQNPSVSRGGPLVSRFCIVPPAAVGRWWDDLLATHPSTQRRIEELDKLPSGLPPVKRTWEGIGSISLVLPAGVVVLLAALAVAIPTLGGQGGASIPQSPTARQQPNVAGLVPSPTRAALATATSAPSTATVIPASATATPTRVPTTTSPVAPTATPTPAPATSTPIPRPPPGTVLQADWSSSAGGWPTTFGWKPLNGMLLNDGSNGNESNWVAAPWDLGKMGVSDYAVEAEIQRVRLSCSSSYGIVVRTGYGAGYQGCPPQFAAIRTITGDTLVYRGAEINEEWHSYRVEVTGNSIKFFIDGSLTVQALDNRYLAGGRVGLWGMNAQVSVRNFKVIVR